MRFLKLSFMPLAMPALLSTGTVEAQEKPEISNAFTTMRVNGREIYAKPATIDAIRPLLPLIVNMAQTDLMLVEPSRLTREDQTDYLKFKVFSEILPKSKTQKILVTDNPYVKKWKRDLQSANAEFSRQMHKYIFEMHFDRAASYKAGQNYSASPFKQGCVITGDMTARPQDIAVALGSIKPSMITSNFSAKFSDLNSILTLVLLHESRHCAQTSAQIFNPADVMEMANIRELRGEIDADMAAAAGYKLLLAQGSRLDPDLPEKIRKLRILSPFLLNDGTAASVIAAVIHGHITGNALKIENPDALKISQDNSSAVTIVNSLIYEMLSVEARLRLEKSSAFQTKMFFRPLFQDVNRALMKATDPLEKDLLTQLYKSYSSAMPIFEKLVVSSMAQTENPVLIYDALYIAASAGWDDDGFSRRVDMRSIAIETLAAWNDLGLAVSSDPGGERIEAYKRALGLDNAKPLRAGRLGPWREISTVWDQSDKASMQERTRPSKPPISPQP